MSNSFEVSFSLREAVLAISRPPKKAAIPASVPKYPRCARMTQVVALALQFQKMIDRGEIRQHSDLARLGSVSRERVSQIMMFRRLAPDIQEAILRSAPNTARPISYQRKRAAEHRAPAVMGPGNANFGAACLGAQAPVSSRRAKHEP